MGRHLVLGATGGFGGAALRQLAAAGLPARALIRDRAGMDRRIRAWGLSGADIEIVEGDAATLSTVLAAAKDCDAILSGLGLPFERWRPGSQPPTLQQLHDNVVEAAGLSGATLVFPGRLIACRPVYGVPQPPEMHTPMHLDNVSANGRIMQQMEAQIEQNCALRGVRALVVRMGTLVGPGVDNPLVGGMIRAALAGQPVLWPGDPQALHLFHPADDAARVAIRLLRERGPEPERGGLPPFTVWNLPGAALDAAGWAGALAEAIGRAVTVRARRGWALRWAALFDPAAAWARGEAEAWEGPLLLDERPTLAALPGLQPSPLADAIRGCAGWISARSA